MEYCTAKNKGKDNLKNLQLYTTAWMNPTNLILSRKQNTKECTQYIPFK